MSEGYQGRIARHRFEPTGNNPGALAPWDPLDPATMRLDRNSSTDPHFAAGHDVRQRRRRWYRLTVDGVEMPRPLSSRWMAFAVEHIQRSAPPGVKRGRARRCEAPERPREVVHLRNGHKGRCGEYGTMTATVGAATCSRCVVDGRPAEVSR